MTTARHPQPLVVQRPSSVQVGALVLVAFFVTLADGRSLGAQDKEYPVRLTAPEKVGNQRTVQKKMTQDLDRVIKKDGKVIQESHVHNEVEFSATVETLEVDAQGRETKAAVTVQKLTLTPAKEKTQEALKPGTAIIAQVKDGKTIFTPKEEKQELPQLATHLLPRVLALGGGQANENEAFDTKKAVKVGASWPADQAAIVKLFRTADPDLKPDAVKGEGQLVGVKKLDGKDCLEIQLSITVQTDGQPAPDTVPVELAIKIGNRTVIPADYSTGPIEQQTDVSMKQVLKGKPGTKNEGLLLEGGSSESGTTKTVYLKK